MKQPQSTRHFRSLRARALPFFLAGAAACVCVCAIAGCRTRGFNPTPRSRPETRPASADSAADSTADSTARLSPLSPWDFAVLVPEPESPEQITTLPGLARLGFTARDHARILLLMKGPSTEAHAITNSRCFESFDAWRVTAVRFSPYETPLPGAHWRWDSWARAQGKTLPWRIELRLVVQPWCVSEKIKSRKAVFPLDQALLLTYELTGAPRAFEDLKVRLGSAMEAGSPFTLTPADQDTLFSLGTDAQAEARRTDLLLRWTRLFRGSGLTQAHYAKLDTYEQERRTSARTSTPSPGALTHPGFGIGPTFARAFEAFIVASARRTELRSIRTFFNEGHSLNQTYRLVVPSGSGWKAAAHVTHGVDIGPTEHAASRPRVRVLPLSLQAPHHAVPLWYEGHAQAVPGLFESQDTVFDESPPSPTQLATHLVKMNDPTRTGWTTTSCASCHGTQRISVVPTGDRPEASGPLPAYGIPETAREFRMLGVGADERQVISVRTLNEIMSDARRHADELTKEGAPATGVRLQRDEARGP